MRSVYFSCEGLCVRDQICVLRVRIAYFARECVLRVRIAYFAHECVTIAYFAHECA